MSLLIDPDRRFGHADAVVQDVRMRLRDAEARHQVGNQWDKLRIDAEIAQWKSRLATYPDPSLPLVDQMAEQVGRELEVREWPDNLYTTCVRISLEDMRYLLDRKRKASGLEPPRRL